MPAYNGSFCPNPDISALLMVLVMPVSLLRLLLRPQAMIAVDTEWHR